MPEGRNLIAEMAQWISGGSEIWLFYLCAALAIGFAYGVILDRRIIRCGFLLIGVFGAMSGMFFLLEAQFLALAQIMIYAVGITLVVVIALMLTNPRLEQDVTPSVPAMRLPAVVSSVGVFFMVYMALRSEMWTHETEQVADASATLTNIGQQLLTYYALPFEFASVLLLVALIGAVMLAKAEPAPPAQVEDWIEPADAEGKEQHAVQV
jgi:NADH:ubiquinone oxidoreductase subunit 6 (subunit J)